MQRILFLQNATITPWWVLLPVKATHLPSTCQDTGVGKMEHGFTANALGTMVTRLDTRQMQHGAYSIDRSGGENSQDCILISEDQQE